MNRRSVLRWLGLAPVAAPAAVVAAAQVEPSAPAVLSRRFTGMFLETLSDGSTRVVFDAQAIDFNTARRRETEARIAADEAMSRRLITAEQRIKQAEASVGRLHPFAFDGETLRVPSAIIPRA